MKGYWINHVIEIKDRDKFFAYATASESMFTGENKYGALMKVFGPVAATLKGEPVSHAALVEFDSIQAAIDFWNDPEYAATRAYLGPLDDESSTVERRVCCIEAEEIIISPNQWFWLNHVSEIINEEAFFKYANASLGHFNVAAFGPVVHQHAGREAIQLAAALGFTSENDALHVRETESYKYALAEGGMADGESNVVNRTICALPATS
ncbi:MAG: DUF1330 domain-containing protein [Betaproteobacteria bacterium]